MPLSDELTEALDGPPADHRCQVYKLGLDEKDQELVDLYVEKIRADKELKQADRLFTTTALVNILKRNGVTIGRTTLAHHVNGECSCVTGE